MKNTWKGLVVGGLTGVAAGLILDGLQTASNRARQVSRKVAENAPVIVDRLGDAAERGASRIHDVHLTEPDAMHARMGNGR